MSEVLENAGLPVLSAGNTVESLSGFDRDAVVASATPTEAENVEPAVPDTAIEHDPFDDENTFDVSRAEFTELQEAYLRLYNGVLAYNRGAPHKIPGV